MNLIAILIGLGIERFLGSLEDYRRFDWFVQFTDWVYLRLEGQGWRDGPLGVLLVIGPPVLLVWLANHGLHGLTPLLSFLFGIAVLLYAIGPKDLARDAEGYIDAIERGDSEGGYWFAAEVLEGDVTGVVPAEVAQQVQDAVLVKSNDRLLGVLFWFFVLGPLGAILYRLACVLRRHTAEDSSAFGRYARNLHALLLWPVARLTVLGYALSGSFMETFGHWRALSELWEWDSERLLVNSGRGALRQQLPEGGYSTDDEPDVEAVKDAVALVNRTVIVWLTALALLTVVGWVS